LCDQAEALFGGELASQRVDLQHQCVASLPDLEVGERLHRGIGTVGDGDGASLRLE
jgi:hypothetical protein